MNKMIKRIVLLFTVVCAFAIQVGLEAAYLNHPPSIKWKRITTEHFYIIYSEDIEAEAQRVANLSEHYLRYNVKTMKPDWRKTTIIIASELAVANGAVFYSPYKSEFYNSPSTFSAGEWFNTLTVHEGRHMVQFNTINSGDRKIFWYVFGDNGFAAYLFLFVPSWFLEGDAVLAETSLTDSGRGRVPNFDLWVRTNELASEPKNRYSYYRAYLGNPLDNYPVANYYVTGYHMVTYGRRKYGADYWYNTIDGMGKDISPFTYFDTSLQKNTPEGKNIEDIYHDAYNDLRAKWLEQKNSVRETPSQTLVAANNARWSAYLAAQESGGRIYALQTGKDLLTGIADVTDAKSQKLIRTVSISTALSGAASNERPFSVGGGKAVWTEDIYDARWGMRSYSSIMVCDLRSGATKRLHSKGKYLSAAISKDGKKIAAVEFDKKRRCSLVIMDSDKGTVLQKIAAKGDDFYFDPAWSDDGRSVAAGVLSVKGNGLYLFDVSRGSVRTLIPHRTDEHPKTPVFAKNFIFYSSDYSGIDNIYAINLKNGSRFQVTSRNYGAYFPSVSESGKTLYFSDYTVKGYSIEQMDIQPAKWTPIAKVKIHRIDYFEPVVAQEAGRSISRETPARVYESEKYTPMFHPFNVYSWMPLVIPYMGIEVYSEDYLRTTQIALGYNYNLNEDAHSVLGTMSYMGLYPVLSVGGIAGERVKADKDDNVITWNEKTAFVSALVPLDFSRGVHALTVSASVTAGMTKIEDKTKIENTAGIIDNGDFSSIAWVFDCTHTVRGTILDLYPRWGQFLNAAYSHTPSGDYSGRQLAFSGALFFPSVFPHHSLYFTGGYEYDEVDRYRYALKFRYPRCYEEDVFERFHMMTANYALPLIYPDIAIWKLMYIKRISSELFFDYGKGELSDKEFYRRSAGVELLFQFNLFSNPDILLEAGAGRVYCFDADVKNQIELIVRFGNTL